MIRTVYMPDSNHVTVPIPEKYIGTELEILIIPINEVSSFKTDKNIFDIDLSFGGWADMKKTTEEICSEIRESRSFRNRELIL